MLRLLSKRAWSRCWSDQQKKDKGCWIRVSIDVCLKRMIYGWNRKTLQHGTRISDLPKPTGTWKVWTSTPSEKQTCYGLQKKNSWQLFDFLVLHTLRETSRYTKYMPFYTVYYVYIYIHYIYSIIYIVSDSFEAPPNITNLGRWVTSWDISLPGLQCAAAPRVDGTPGGCLRVSRVEAI